MGQMKETFQERPSCVPPSDTETYPREERKVVTTMDGLTLDGSFIPHSNFLFYQEKEQEPETKTEVAYHFVYRIDIGDTLCDKFPIENNSLSGNPTPSSDSMVESLSPLPTPFEDSDSLLEETDTLFSHFDNSSPEYETFSFDMEKKSSGSITTHYDYSLSDYDAFYFDDDHIEEKSSDSTTTHSDFSLPEYDLFIFDLSFDPFPPADRSVSHHEEFADELAHVISSPEYDRFYFDLEIIPGDFTRVLEENIFNLSTKGLTINELNDSSLLLSDCDSSLSKEFFEIDLLRKSSGSTTTHSDYSCLDYEAFYFDDDHIKEKSTDRSVSHHEEFTDELAHIISPPEYDRFYFDLEIIPGEFTRVLEENIFDLSTKGLTINELNDSSLLLSDCDSSLSKEFSEIDLLVSFPSGNKDKIFNPGIFIIKRVQSKRFHIFPLDDFPTISFVSDSLLLINPSKIDTFLSFLSGNEDKVFDPGILLINGIFSFTRKSPHLLINNFLIDKCHILSEISLMTESSVSFHPKDKEIRGESS
ncbi:hypothetical protein Tco_1087590 [Tanacetum coccineum]